MIKKFSKVAVFFKVIFFVQIVFFNYDISFFASNKTPQDFLGSDDAASMMLSIKDDPGFTAELSKISGIVEPEVLDGIMDQLKLMEGDSEEAIAKRKEFNEICNQMMTEMQGQEEDSTSPAAKEEEFDNHVHLEDEKDYDELPDDKKNNVHCNGWLDVLRNCQSPISKDQKKIFREGIFSFEKMIKSIKSEHNSNYLLYSDLKINMELLGINLHQFRRPFKMRYLFENKPEAKQLRTDLADSVEKIEALIVLQEKKRKKQAFQSVEEETSFLGSFWASKKKKKDKKNTKNKSIGKSNKKIERLLLDITKVLSSSNKKLDKILISKEMLSKEGLKKKMNHVVKKYSQAKYPSSYGRYQDRLSNAGAEYGGYGSGRESGSNGWDNSWNPDSPSHDLENGFENKEAASSANNSSDSKPQAFAGPAVFEEHAELISLLKSEIYKSLLVLDSNLSVLDKNSSQKLTSGFLNLKLSDLKPKLDAALKSLNISSGKSSSDNDTKSEKKDMSKEEIALRRKNVRDAFSKIFRPIYYLNNNLRKISPIARENKSDYNNNSILILPALSMLEGETEAVTALSKTIQNPCLDTCLALQTFYSSNSKNFLEISNVISSILSTIETDVEEKQKSEVTKAWDMFTERLFFENDNLVFSMLNNLSASTSSFTFESEDFCKKLTNLLEAIILIHFDYPGIDGIVTLEKNQKLMKMFFSEFAKVFRKQMMAIFESEDLVDDFLMHNILSSFEDFTEGLGYRQLRAGWQSENSNVSKKIMRSAVLLCNFFGNIVFSEDTIFEDNPNSADGWGGIFSSLGLLLNFKKEDERFSQENRSRLAGKTTDSILGKIPREYLSWCLGESDIINKNIFDLYKRISAQASSTSESISETYFSETVREIHRCLAKIETGKSSIDIKKIKSDFVLRAMSIISSYHPLGENIILDNSDLDPKGVNNGDLFEEANTVLASISFLYEFRSNLMDDDKSFSSKSNILLFHKNKIAEELIFIFLDLGNEKININESAKKLDDLLLEASSIRTAFWQLKKIITAGMIGNKFQSQLSQEPDQSDPSSLAISFGKKIDIPEEFIVDEHFFNKTFFENDAISPFLLIVQIMNPLALEFFNKDSIEIIFKKFQDLDSSLSLMASSLEQVDLDRIASIILEKVVNVLPEKILVTDINPEEILKNLVNEIAEYFNQKVSGSDLPQAKINLYDDLVNELASA